MTDQPQETPVIEAIPEAVKPNGSNGIDVSNYNNGLKLSTITGLDFVIAKATEGTGYIDPDYTGFMQQAHSLGVIFHAYHFVHVGQGDPAGQADLFWATARLTEGILWADYETNEATPSQDQGWLNVFFGRLREHNPHCKTGLYTNLTGFQRLAGVVGPLECDYLWYAHPDDTLEDTQPLPDGRNWLIHQYTTVAGIDRDWCNRDRADLAASGSWAAPQAPAPPTPPSPPVIQTGYLVRPDATTGGFEGVDVVSHDGGKTWIQS